METATRDVTMATTPAVTMATRPKMLDFSHQTESCCICKELGHTEMQCYLELDRPPPPLTCRQCKHRHTPSYTGLEMTTQTLLCALHRTSALTQPVAASHSQPAVPCVAARRSSVTKRPPIVVTVAAYNVKH